MVLNKITHIKKDMSGKEHWYTNDQLMLSEHPFYKRTTSERLGFFRRCLNEYLSGLKDKDGDSVILDAGSGDGVVLGGVKGSADCFIVGCEYNFIRAKRAQLNCRNVHIVNASLLQAPFKKKAFNFIILNQVLEHISEDKATLAEIASLLKDNGMIIIGVPNEGCFLGKLRNQYIQSWILRQTDHVNFYTENEIRVKIEDIGLSVVCTRRDGFMFPYSRIGDLLASFSLGFILSSFLGRIFKSQCGGLYFLCKKNNK